MATVSFEFTQKKFLNKKKNPYNFKRKKKPLIIEFDESSRIDFLTGFQKRKLQRKKKAQEDLEKEIKAEKARLRIAAKNAFKKLVVSHRDIPELGEVQEDTNLVDMGTHEVQITELDPDKLARDNNWIGRNHLSSLNMAKVEMKKKESSEQEFGESGNEIVGMETSVKRKTINQDLPNFKTTKDIKKFVKSVATKNMKQSKVFQKKKDVEARKNKKRKLRAEHKREKEIKTKKKKRGKRRSNNR